MTAPSVAPQKAKIFISYKRGADPDEALAKLLHNALLSAGCDPFYDQNLLPSVEWEKELDKKITGSDFFLLLLSHSSADSLHVSNELATAHEAANGTESGAPHIVTILVSGYRGLPRFAMRSVVRNFQQLTWNSDNDDAAVFDMLSGLISGKGFEFRRTAIPERTASAMSPLAALLRPALMPHADAYSQQRDFVDEHLYLALTLNGFFKALLLHLPPDDIQGVPPEEEDIGIRHVRDRVAVMANYVSSTRKDARLRAGFDNLIGVLEKYLDVVPKRRQLGVTRNLAVRQMWQDVNARQRSALKGRTLETTEVLIEFSDYMGERSRREKLIDIEYAEKDRALRLEFTRCYGDAWSRTVVSLQQLAEARDWPDTEWHFDGESEAWMQVRKLSFQQDFKRRAVFLESLRNQYPHDPWVSLFYLHNVVPEDLAGHQKHLRIAASAGLNLPGSSFHDETRLAVVSQAARAGTAILRERQAGKKFGEADVSFAQGVQELWAIWARFQPELDPEERTEAHVFALAATGKLKEALALADSRDLTLSYSAELSFTMTRLAARLGKLSYALEWMKYGLGQANGFSVTRCLSEPDLEALRQGKADEFRQLTAVKCEVVCDSGWVSHDIVLKNRSAFPLTNVRMKVKVPDAGWIQLPSQPRVGADGATHKWAWVSLVFGDRNTRSNVAFELTCAEGACRG